MKKMIALWLLFSVAIISLSAQKALVIGNAGYAQKPLRHPAVDAAAIDTTLTNAGWQVTRMTNVSGSAFKNAITTFAKSLKDTDMAIVYFGGAVVQLDGLNYLVPVGTTYKDVNTFKTQAVELGWLMTQIAKSPVKLVFVDGARAPANVTFGITKGGLAAVSKAPSGTLLMYSSPKDTLMADGAGTVSNFARILGGELIKPDLSAVNLQNNITNAMKAASGSRTPPIPWSLNTIPNDVVINPSGQQGNRFYFRGSFKMMDDGGGSYSF